MKNIPFGIAMYHQSTSKNDYPFLVYLITLQENISLESRIKSPDETRDFKKVSISGVSSLVWSSSRVHYNYIPREKSCLESTYLHLLSLFFQSPLSHALSFGALLILGVMEAAPKDFSRAEEISRYRHSPFRV